MWLAAGETAGQINGGGKTSIGAVITREGYVRKIDKTPYLLAFIFGVPIALSLRATIYNPDLFYHLRTGDWILLNHAFPQTDPFAQGGAQRIYIAYSWLFDVMGAKLYSAFGLLFVPVIQTLLAVAIALALFLLIRSFRVGLIPTALLILFAMIAMRPLLYLRTWLFTILFFSLELWLLFRPGGNPKRVLIILPAIFVFWTNIHIQFIYGLFIVGLFLAEAVFWRLTKWRQSSVAPQWTLADRALLLLLCGLATLVNPYGYRIYKVIAEYASQNGIFPYIHETWPLNSHHPSYAVCLIISAAAIWSVGYYRESRPFVLVFLAWALFTGFHLSRDSWVLVVASCFVIAATNSDLIKIEEVIRLRSILGASAIVLILFAGLWRMRHIDRQHLEATVTENYPVDAADYIERNRLRGPLFNTFGWGGYLMWRLPFLPVSIDGRTNLYGAARVARQRNTLSAGPEWAQDPSIQAARLILVPVDEPLTSVLKMDPCYRLAYSDSVSAVFTTGDDCSHVDCAAALPDKH